MPKLLTLLIFLTLSSVAVAADFDIYQSAFRPMKVAIQVSADAAGKDRFRFSGVIRNDLKSSQSFEVIDPMAYLPTFEESWAKVEYGDWTILGTEVLAQVRMYEEQGSWKAELRVYDVFRKKALASMTVEAAQGRPRLLAHRVADQIYEAALGIPGYFTSHVLYVHKRGEFSDLIYMDQDGANRQIVGKNFTLLLSPDWAPDGQSVALNTYVGNRPRLEFFNLRSGARTAFGEFKGLNSTPEFSPDGRYVAATLSHDTGNTDIHIYDIKTGKWRRFTHHKGIDTTPSWSPDGKWIAFVSNRSGQPQVYRKPVDGGKALRVSKEGSYNTSPSWSPRGDRIAMISLKNWAYAVATVRPDGSDVRYLVAGSRVESPSWAPNGQMILFSAEDRGVRRVYRVPSWGGRSEPITPSNIDASDPAWSRR